MKIAIITDTHFGAKNDSLIFSNYIMNFYLNIFFPYLIKHKITHVIHLGDMFDRRKYINFEILERFENMFMKQLYNHQINLTILTGNHDVYYKNTNRLNSLDLLLREGLYQDLLVLNHTHTIKLNNTEILLIPWINEENYNETIQSIKNSKAKIVLGHLELAGFPMYKGMTNQEGMDTTIFKKFDLVCSGHFHHRSTKGNIHYLGCPYEITWADFNDPKGFHILDTTTQDLEFVENPLKLFYKIIYDDKTTDYMTEPVDIYKNRYVKLIVKNKGCDKMYDYFVNNLYNINPANVVILDNLDDYSVRQHQTKDVDVEDTSKFITNYVGDMDLVDDHKKELDDRLLNTYTKALKIDSE